MTSAPNRAKVLIADVGPSPWANGLAHSLQSLPVDLHWSRSDVEAIDLVSGQALHLAIVDQQLPGGGISLVRRLRTMGLTLPSLLVCETANQRLLQEALEADIFSVITRESPRDLLTPTVLKVFRQFYRFDWSPPETAN